MSTETGSCWPREPRALTWLRHTHQPRRHPATATRSAAIASTVVRERRDGMGGDKTMAVGRERLEVGDKFGGRGVSRLRVRLQALRNDPIERFRNVRIERPD